MIKSYPDRSSVKSGNIRIERKEMKNKLSFLGFVLLASTLIISGCALTTDETTEVPIVVTTDVTPEGPVDIEYAVARDAALAYISEKHGEQPPPSGSTWEWESPAPDPLAGPDSYQYTAGDWEATISRLVVVPDSAAYRVKVINRSTGFRWDGEVDAAAQVTELPPREPPQASEWVLDARDAALAYLIENYGDQAPPSDLTWPDAWGNFIALKSPITSEDMGAALSRCLEVARRPTNGSESAATTVPLERDIAKPPVKSVPRPRRARRARRLVGSALRSVGIEPSDLKRWFRVD